MVRCLVELVACVAGYGRRRVVEASLKASRGLVCVIGPNASGKTTLLKTVAGLLKPLGGVVYLDGRSVHSMGVVERSRRVAALLTGAPRLPLMRVREVVLLGRTPWVRLLPTKADERGAEEALRRAGVEHLADRYFNTLSDGEKQRVLIAMALARRPSLLVMDEPTSFLDPNHRVAVFKLLKDLSRGMPVLVSSHEVELALRFCDKVYYIHPSGVVRELGSEEELDSVYGMEGAFFSKITGTLELRLPRGEPTTHIVGGCGSALVAVRRLGLYEPLSVGPVYPNDVDNIILSEMGARVYTSTGGGLGGLVEDVCRRGVRVVAARVPPCCRPRAAEELLGELARRGVGVEWFDPGLGGET